MSGRTRRTADRRRVRAGVVAVLLIVVSIYAAFIRHAPFDNPYEIHALFATGNQLRTGNPVRVSGVQVGRVTAIAAGPGATTKVTMRLSRPEAVSAEPTMAIKPRL